MAVTLRVIARIFLVAGIISCFVPEVGAQTTPELTGCADTDADTSIAACSALIGIAGQSDATLGKAFTYRGFSYLKKNQSDNAIEDFNQAVRLDPGNAWAFANRGNAYFNKHQQDRALADYAEALRLNPAGYATLFYGMGSIERAKGKTELAIEQFGQAIQLKADFPEALNGRGNAYFDNGQYSRAIEDFDRALELRKDYRSAVQSRAGAYAALGQYERSIADYDKAAGAQPNAGLLRERGIVYRAKGDFEKAIGELNAAVSLTPSAGALDDRGDAYLEAGQIARALQDYNEAVRSAKDDPDALQSQGRAAYYLGKWSEAATDFEKSLSLDSADPYGVIWLHLANARAGRDDSRELPEQARKIQTDEWPGPVVNLFLGKLKPSIAIAFASNADPDKRTHQRCEAEYFVGEYLLTLPDKTSAPEHLAEARRICSGVFIEALAAKMELKRLESSSR